MHSYWISNCSGLVTLEGLSSTLTLVTLIAVMVPQRGLQRTERTSALLSRQAGGVALPASAATVERQAASGGRLSVAHARQSGAAAPGAGTRELKLRPPTSKPAAPLLLGVLAAHALLHPAAVIKGCRPRGWAEGGERV